jgi:uncharacterized membrane protein YphA (DoxX/SURF4 family)
MNSSTLERIAEWFLRIALSVAFLSAVADRLGLWGKPGSPGVAWGDWQHFQSYSDQLNSWLPAALRTPAAWLATIAEVLLAVALLIPIGTRWTAAAAGTLLCVFALSMTFKLGLKAPLDYSVWTAAAAAFFLAASDTIRTNV